MTMPKGWTQPKAEFNGNETVIWSNQIEEGIFNRHVVESQVITNHRVTLNNTSYNLEDLDDIIVLNSHHEARGQGMRIRGYGGVSYGTGSSKGKTVGDIAFMYQGQPVIVFHQIPDPSGVARLAKSAKKAIIKKPKPEPQPYDDQTYSENQDDKFVGGRIDDSEHPNEVDPNLPYNPNTNSPSPSKIKEFSIITAEQIKQLNDQRLKNGEITANSPRCPKDGMIQYNSCAFCVVCGTRLIRNIGDLTNLPKSDGIPVSYCPKDGMIHYSELMRFCALCGSGLVLPEPDLPEVISNGKKCGKCNHVNESGSSFCNNCGFSLA